jgi:hypothetical protein
MNVIDPIIQGYIYNSNTTNGETTRQIGGLPIPRILDANTAHTGETFILDKRNVVYSVPTGLVMIEDNRGNQVSYKYTGEPSQCEVISNGLFDKLIGMVSNNKRHSRKTHKQKGKTGTNKKTKSARG